MSNIAFCSKAFRRKTWVIIGYENQIIQNKNRFRFTPICPTPVLTIDNIILYNFFRIDNTDNIIQILCRYTCSLCRQSMATLFVQVDFDKILHTLCYFLRRIQSYIFLHSLAFFSIKIYLYTLSLKIYKNGHCNLELKIGTTNVCKYPILI